VKKVSEDGRDGVGPADEYAARVTAAPTLRVGRYAVFEAFASGGMGTVHFGHDPDGRPGQVVAVKRLHPHLRKEVAFADLILDEARLAMSVRHQNVVQVIDVVSTDDDLLLVMEYVRGLSLHELLRASPDARVPFDIAVSIAIDVLHGLHAAHEAVGPDGKPLGLVHRDVSPQNLLVDTLGVTKLTDFGVAKAAGRLRSTRDGSIKGKIAYMSPEQVACAPLDARSDVYATAVVLWEMIAGRPMFEAKSDLALIGKAMRGPTEHVSAIVPDVPRPLDAALWRALSRDPRRRHATALAFADALIEAVGAGDPKKVAAWVLERGQAELEARERVVSRVLRAADVQPTAALVPAPPAEIIELDVPAEVTAPGLVRPATSAKSRVRAFGLVAAVLTVLTLAMLFLRTNRRASAVDPSESQERGSPPAPTSTPSMLEPPPASSAPEAPPSARVEPSARAEEVAPVAASAVPTARSAPTAGAHRRSPTGSPRRESEPKTTTKADSRRNCNPPYSIDQNGDKHFKPECLR